MRDTLARALALDKSGLQPLVALRAAAGVAIPLAIGAAVGHPAEGAIAAAGALPAGVAGLAGGFRSRASLIIATSAGMAVSTFAGGLVAGHFTPLLLTLLVWGFLGGIAVVLGREASIVGTQAIIGLAVFGRFPSSVAASAGHAGWVLAGGALQGLLAAAIRPPQRFTAERRALAHAYAQLARLAHDLSQPGLGAAEAAQSAADHVARRYPDGDVDLLRGLADEASRIRLELQSLAAFPDVSGIGQVTAAVAGWLRRTSQALRDGTAAREEDPALAAAVEALAAGRREAPPGREGTPARYAAARASALLGQLRAVDRLTSALTGIQRLTLPHVIGAPTVLAMPRQVASSLRRFTAAIRAPGSPAFRHAVRLALMMVIAEVVARALPWQRGYWVTLTVVVVLKPDYAATVQRGIARIVGTALGVGLSGLISAAIHPTDATLVALVAVLAWMAYAAFAASYAVYSFAITALVVLLLAPLGGGSELSTVADRGLDTLIGGALALIGYAAWPTWESQTLTARISQLFADLAAYASPVLSAYVDPEVADRGAIGRAANRARRSRADAQASLDRALAEPARGGADTRTAAGMMAAARRIVIALHALRTTIDDTTEHVAIPEVAAISGAITSALLSLAADDPAGIADLREQQQALEAAAVDDPASLRARRLALVAAHLDPLVDAVNTGAHVLSER